jgi:hypothetical protein
VTARTSQVKASVGCDYRRMVGIPMAFTLEGPGSISPASTQTGSDGYAYSTYTATDTGTAVITATATTCDQWQKPRTSSEPVSIEVDSCGNWVLIVEMTVTHSTLNFDFQDEITMIIPLVISETGEITSRTADADGTHAASLVTFGPDCVVTQAYTPDFVPGAIGNVVGSTAYVTIAPVAEWALLYVVTCIVDDEPYYIPMPPYNYLIPSLMASQMFNEYPVVLENGTFYNGSGVDTEWSEDYPISYTFQITVHGEK